MKVLHVHKVYFPTNLCKMSRNDKSLVADSGNNFQIIFMYNLMNIFSNRANVSNRVTYVIRHHYLAWKAVAKKSPREIYKHNAGNREDQWDSRVDAVARLRPRVQKSIRFMASEGLPCEKGVQKNKEKE